MLSRQAETRQQLEPVFEYLLWTQFHRPEASIRQSDSDLFSAGAQSPIMLAGGSWSFGTKTFSWLLPGTTAATGDVMQMAQPAGLTSSYPVSHAQIAPCDCSGRQWTRALVTITHMPAALLSMW